MRTQHGPFFGGGLFYRGPKFCVDYYKGVCKSLFKCLSNPTRLLSYIIRAAFKCYKFLADKIYWLIFILPNLHAPSTYSWVKFMIKMIKIKLKVYPCEEKIFSLKKWNQNNSFNCRQILSMQSLNLSLS